MRRPLFAFALLALLPLLATSCSRSSSDTPLAAAEDPTRALREATLTSSQAYETVRSLTDEAGPRLAGSSGGKIAVAWAVRALTAAGLARVHTEPVTVPHWERGLERGELIAPRRES